MQLLSIVGVGKIRIKTLNSQQQTNRLRDYSTLFSRSCALEWMKGDLSSILMKVERYDESWLDKESASYMDYLRYVYGMLSENYRNEYVVKNSFLNEWLIDQVGKDNGKVYSEFRVGDSVADLAMFNGLSRVFEIKTELDSDKRLQSQIDNYKKIFNEVYLIVSQSKLDTYTDYDDSVGIIVYEDFGTDSFRINREARKQESVDYRTVMQVLHSKEYLRIVRSYFTQIPKMTSFNQFEICSELIKEIPQSRLNALFIAELKRRGSNNELSIRYFKELNQLSVALKLSRRERQKMISVLRCPLTE